MKRYRPVAQQDKWGCGVACVASVLGITYADVIARLKNGSKNGHGQGKEPSSEALRRVLNDAFRNTGLAYELDRPFIGDPDGLETGSIVSLSSGHCLMRAADGWMDPTGGKIRRRLPGEVRQALVLTPTHS